MQTPMYFILSLFSEQSLTDRQDHAFPVHFPDELQKNSSLIVLRITNTHGKKNKLRNMEL